MKRETARTLAVLSAISIVVALAAPSPALVMFLMIVSVAAAVPPAIAAPAPFKLWGLVLLVLSVFLFYINYDDFSREQQQYRARVLKRPAPAAPPVSPDPATQGGRP